MVPVVPFEPELETTAVNDTLVPATSGLPDVATTVRVEAALTVSGTAVEVAIAVVAPDDAKYSAVIESVPTGKLFVTKLAMPLPDRATVPSSVVPSKNSAMPAVAPLTVAVIKTDWPYCDVLGRFCKATVMADVLKLWVEGRECQPMGETESSRRSSSGSTRRRTPSVRRRLE